MSACFCGKLKSSPTYLSSKNKKIRDRVDPRVQLVWRLRVKVSCHSPFSIPHSPFLVLHSPFSILHSPFSIPHSPFCILHSPFSIPHSPFPIPRSPFSILHFPFPIFHFPFPISHFPFPIPHSPFPIPHFPFPISHFPFPISHFPFPIPQSPFSIPHPSILVLQSPFHNPHTTIFILQFSICSWRHKFMQIKRPPCCCSPRVWNFMQIYRHLYRALFQILLFYGYFRWKKSRITRQYILPRITVLWTKRRA